MLKIPFTNDYWITNDYKVYHNGLIKNDFVLKFKDLTIINKETIYLYSLFEIDKYNLNNDELKLVKFIKIDKKLLLSRNGYIMLFKKPIVHNNRYLIPGIPNAYIDDNYCLYYEINGHSRIKDLKSRLYRKLKDYPSVYIHHIRDDIKVHRLIAISMLTHNDDNKLYINHKDGNKFNFNKENLEWCNITQNNIHAVETGIVGDYKIKVYDILKQKYSYFGSQSSFLRYIGVDYKKKRLNFYINNPSKLYLDRYALFTPDYNIEIIYKNKKINRRVTIYNVYKQGKLIESIFGKTEFKKYFKIQFSDEKSALNYVKNNYPDLEIKVIESDNKPTKMKTHNENYKIKLINNETKEEIIFNSLRSISKYLNVDRSVIKNRLKNNKPFKHFIIRPVNDENC